MVDLQFIPLSCGHIIEVRLVEHTFEIHGGHQVAGKWFFCDECGIFTPARRRIDKYGTMFYMQFTYSEYIVPIKLGVQLTDRLWVAKWNDDVCVIAPYGDKQTLHARLREVLNAENTYRDDD